MRINGRQPGGQTFLTQRVRALCAIVFFAWTVLAWSASAGDRVSLWEVKSDTATVYLLGSVHVARSDIYPLDGRIEKAFQTSQVLVVEANMLDQRADQAMHMMATAAYPPGDSVDKHISKEVYDRTEIGRASCRERV